MPAWMYIAVVFGVHTVLDLLIATTVARGMGALFRLGSGGWLRAWLTGIAVTACLTLLRACSGWLLPGVKWAAVLLLVGIVLAPVLFRAIMGRSDWRGGFLAAPAFAACCAIGFVVPAGVMYATVGRTLAVATASMSPTFDRGDLVIVDGTIPPRRWDVIAFYAPFAPNEIYIKRLVGLPGETVELIDGGVTIDGRAVPMPQESQWLRYDTSPIGTLPFCRGGPGHPMKLGAGEYYVLGDNTHASIDSRNSPQTGASRAQAGAVPAASVIGVVRLRYAPIGRIRMFR